MSIDATRGAAHHTPHSTDTPTEPVHSAVRAQARARITDPSVVDNRWKELGAKLFRWARSYAEGEIPTVWSESPTTLAELVRYARVGAWIGPGSTFWRGLGVAWCVLVAIPVSTVAYYAAWFFQRPGRTAIGALACLALYQWIS